MDQREVNPLTLIHPYYHRWTRTRWLPLFLCFISLFPLQAWAQWSEEEGVIVSENGYVRYIGVGGGVLYALQRDNALTSIRYEGPGLAAQLSHSKEQDRLYLEWEALGQFSRQSYSGDPLLPASLSNTRLSLDYRALGCLNPEAERRATRTYLGGLFAGVFDQSYYPHLQESSLGQSYALSLGATVMFRKEIEVYDHPAFLSWDFSFPIFSLVGRTDYLNRRQSLDEDFRPFRSLVDRSKAGMWGRYLRLHSRWTYTYVLGNGNRLLVSYQWNFARLRRDQDLYTGTHQLGFQFQFNY